MRYKPGWTAVLLFSAGAILGAAFICNGRLFDGGLSLARCLPMAALFLWARLTTYVEVHDQGVAWRDGGIRKSLAWDRIAGCCVERRPDGPPALYLVEEGTLGMRELPVFRVALMKSVARRRGRFTHQLVRLGAAR